MTTISAREFKESLDRTRGGLPRSGRSFAYDNDLAIHVELLDGRPTGKVATGYRVVGDDLVVDYVDGPIEEPKNVDVPQVAVASTENVTVPEAVEAAPTPPTVEQTTIVGAVTRYAVEWDWEYGAEVQYFDTLSAARSYPEKVRAKYPHLTGDVEFRIFRDLYQREKLDL